MKERPILFSGPMVRAILAGTKTMTRRVVKDYPAEGTYTQYPLCPYGCSGELLWVRETWALPPSYRPDLHGDLKTPPRIGPVSYKANYSSYPPWDGTVWRPSIFMPRWASRITLEITGVRVERLQEIGEEDAKAEGFTTQNGHLYRPLGSKGPMQQYTSRQEFSSIWNGLNAKRGFGWEKNPFVWVIYFQRIEQRRRNSHGPGSTDRNSRQIHYS